MKDYIISAHATVYVAGQELAPDLMTDAERVAVIECVNGLFTPYGSRIFFDTDPTEDDEGHAILLVHCFQETPDGRDSHLIPFPPEWVSKTITMSNGKVFALIGDKIPIAPSLPGNHPWKFVEIKITNYADE